MTFNQWYEERKIDLEKTDVSKLLFETVWNAAVIETISATQAK